VSSDNKPKSWWETVPGLITAIATVITAVAGLIIALNQAGFLHDAPSDSTNLNNTSGGDVELVASTSLQDKGTEINHAGRSKSAPLNQGQQIPLSIPQDFTYGSLLFQIMSADLNNFSDTKSKVRFHFLIINQGQGAYDLSPSTFRLLVGDIPYSPDNFFSEYIPGDSSKELQVNFIVPNSSSYIHLRIGKKGGEKTRTIAIIVPKA